MKNRVIYRKKSGAEWAELALVGQRPLLAKLDVSDVDLASEYRWGWHPRGPFDHKRGILLTHVLLPNAQRIYFRNWNRLDCRRENLFTEQEAPLLRKRLVPGAKGVFYDPIRCAFIAHYSHRRIQVFGYFAVKDFTSASAAEEAAKSRRADFLKMGVPDLIAYKQKREPSEHERWLGEDVAAAIAEREPDPQMVARRSFQAGLMASRVLGAQEEDTLFASFTNPDLGVAW